MQPVTIALGNNALHIQTAQLPRLGVIIKAGCNPCEEGGRQCTEKMGGREPLQKDRARRREGCFRLLETAKRLLEKSCTDRNVSTQAQQFCCRIARNRKVGALPASASARRRSSLPLPHSPSTIAAFLSHFTAESRSSASRAERPSIRRAERPSESLCQTLSRERHSKTPLRREGAASPVSAVCRPFFSSKDRQLLQPRPCEKASQD